MFFRKKKTVTGSPEYIIAGLGNPGKEYEETRHNMGFMAVDLISEKTGIRVDMLKHKALVGTGVIGDRKVMLVKPQTYMNESGKSLREIVNFYKIPVSNLIVIYDDVDLKEGVLRIRKQGSAGTHNGMKSIIYQLASDEFPRIRIGMAGNRRGDLVNYVLGKLNEEEEKVLAKVLEDSAEAAMKIVTDGVDKAMNVYNTRRAEDAE